MNFKKSSRQSASSEAESVSLPLESASRNPTKRPVLHGWTRFLALWVVSGANYFAYGTMVLALALFAAHLTRLPLLVSGISFAQLLPTLVLGLPIGVLVDHFDRRQILIATTASRVLAFTIAILAVLAGFVSLPLLYALALLLGITETIEEPALAAAVPMVVARETLERANTFLVGAQNMLGLLADPLGALFVNISIVLSMSVSGLCAALALAALFFLRGPLRPPFPSMRDTTMQDKEGTKPGKMRHRPATWRTIRTDTLEGLRYLWRERLLLTIAVMAGIINACWSGFLVVMVLYAVSPGPLGLSTPIYGLLLMLPSIGSLIGVVITLPIQRCLGKRWAIGLNIFGNGLMFAVPALTHNLWLIGAAMFIGGAGGPMWTITAASLQGCIVPSALQGRVNATYRMLSNGTSALGPLAAGLLAQVFGLPATLAILGLLTWFQLIPFFPIVTERAMQRNG